MKNIKVLTLTVGNLADYNGGVYNDITISLPMEEIELNEALIKLSRNFNEELEIFDWELEEDYRALLEVNPYANIEKLNEVAISLAELDLSDLEVIGAIARTQELSFEEAKEEVDNVMYFRVDNDNMNSLEFNVGFDYLENVYGSVEGLEKETLLSYFDDDSFVEDMYLNGEHHIYFEEEVEEGNINFDDMYKYEICDMLRDFIEDIDLGKEVLSRYFDYERFGRDLLFDFTVDSETDLVISNY